MQEPHRLLCDDSFLYQFSTGSLEPEWFTHEAHLRLAYLLIFRNGQKVAEGIITRQIKAFDQRHGDGTKFHITLTLASLKTVAHFMQRAPHLSFEDLLQAYPRLRVDLKGLLLSHYSERILLNPNAKTSFYFPDLLPFESSRQML